MMKVHETRRNLPEDSARAYDYGGYYKLAEMQNHSLLHGKKLATIKSDERKDMIAQRTILRERKERGLDVKEKSKAEAEEVTYDDDEDDF